MKTPIHNCEASIWPPEFTITAPSPWYERFNRVVNVSQFLKIIIALSILGYSLTTTSFGFQAISALLTIVSFVSTGRMVIAGAEPARASANAVDAGVILESSDEESSDDTN